MHKHIIANCGKDHGTRDHAAADHSRGNLVLEGNQLSWYAKEYGTFRIHARNLKMLQQQAWYNQQQPHITVEHRVN